MSDTEPFLSPASSRVSNVAYRFLTKIRDYGAPISCVLGGLVGGPIGFLFAKLLHMGIAGTVLIDIATTGAGLKLGHYFHQNYRTADTSLIHLYGRPDTERLVEIRQLLHTGDEAHCITSFSIIFDTDPWFRSTYQSLLGHYLAATTPEHRLEAAHEVLDTLRQLLRQLLFCTTAKTSRQVNNQEREAELLLLSVTETLVTMSLYESIWRACIEITRERDTAYREALPHGELCQDIRFHKDLVSETVLIQLRRLLQAHTPSGKISALVSLSRALDSMETKVMDGDRHLELLTSLLYAYRKMVRYPFAELLYMTHLFPNSTGREDYLLSNWEAAATYIARKPTGDGEIEL